MLSDIQLKLMALFAVVEPKVQTHYLTRFENANPEYLSDNETILLKDLNDYLVEASIIERGSEIPFIKVNNMNSLAITPDIVAASYELKPIMNGGTATFINGQMIDPQKYQEDRLLLKLKNAILKTKEKMAANAFLQGKYIQANSGTEINFEFNTPTKKDAKKIDNWVTFFFDIIDDYEKVNGVMPDRIELGRTLFDKLIKNNEFIEIAKAYSNSIGLSADEKQVYLDLLGQRISKLRTAQDFNGNNIPTDNMIYLSNDNALVPVFAALEAVDTSGKPFVFVGKEILDETPANKETARAKMFCKSAFAPVVALKDLIVRYEIQNTDSISIVPNSK